MQRESKAYMQDMLDSCGKIGNYIEGLSYEKFCKDQLRIDAVVHNLEIIGEAAKNMPAEERKKYPEVEWKKITGLRDVIVHGYFNLRTDIVWDIAKNKVPELKERLSRAKTD